MGVVSVKFSCVRHCTWSCAAGWVVYLNSTQPCQVGKDLEVAKVMELESRSCWVFDVVQCHGLTSDCFMRSLQFSNLRSREQMDRSGSVKKGGWITN